MKRIIGIISTLILTVALVLSFTACNKEIENGSVITRVTFELEFYNGNEVEKTTTVTAKLYTTFAEKTTAQIVKLINEGYYNGKCISNVSSNYAQFGGYTLNDKGELVAADTNVSAVDGEFYNNGITGNRLVVKEGALVLMRDSGYSVEAYNSGKATIAVCFSSNAPFNSSEYCVFGELLSDDGDANADSESLEKLSSVERAKKIADTLSTDDGTKVYYVVSDKNEKDAFAGYYTLYKDEDGTAYYEGIISENELKENGEAYADKKLADEKADLLKDRISSTNNKFEYYTLPINRVIVKKATVIK